MKSTFYGLTLLLGLLVNQNLLAEAGAPSKQATAELTTNKFFRHIMFRESPYASYRGIHAVEEKLPKDLAHYQFQYDQQGRVIDIAYQINDRLIRDNQVWDSFIWFAPRVSIRYESNKEIHQYYDLSNNQVAVHGQVYQAEYALNKQGERVSLKFYDQSGAPVESEWNIHRYEWRHANGKVYEKRFNLDNEQQPLRPVLEFYEVELEYNQKGQLAFMRNLGLTGEPTNNSSGAGIDRIVYDHNGNFVRWQVYDKDGKPVEGNRPMVHIGEHLYDEFGNKVGMRGFDRYGKRIPFSWGAFEHVSVFDKHGNQSEHLIYQADGRLDRRLSIEYTEQLTEVEWLRSLTEAGDLIASPMLGGAATMKLVYHDDGTVERQLFNADGTPYVPQQAKSN
ncbi:hypothetical protein [Pleionea litopenaei]|uniref:Antitoxin component YwqK of YwqJK toxin-antitoxin module n=1 Tax=Pleionea litopenaei TaxID=3070815 RepID=A0AA51X8H3_9GAMM|nr:hypothetical protein [Pleionea sp. HL-JVS1]WMS88929.1 hypothetical protein Q9312_08440 [Pleionea sp. HL-JVS1]